MKYPGLVTTLAALALMMNEVSAQTTPAARLTVEVTNGTAHGATVVGDSVTLLLYRGPEQVESLQAQVGEDGKAVFENVSTGPDRAAVARAKHQNMAFNSRPVLLAPGGSEFSVEVQVFDVSTDTSQLSVGTHHITVAVRVASLEFTEYMQLSNASDLAVTGPQRDDQSRPIVIEVKLPQGFRDLAVSSYLEMDALVITKDGFYDTLAMPPGEHQVAFSYKLDIGRSAMNVTKELTLPTAELTVFWEQGQGRLEGLGDPTGRLVNAEGVPTEYYSRAALKPGDRFALRISGFNVKRSDGSTWIILAVVFAAIVTVALVRRGPRPVEGGKDHA